MPTARAPHKLSTLLDLLRAKGVREYEVSPDGRVRVVFGAAPAQTEASPTPRGRRSAPRESLSAIDLALQGIAYDPDVVDTEETH